MPELWVPGSAGPLEELVDRVHRRIEAYAAEHGEAVVEVELADGSTLVVQSLAAEPGYGFLTLVPHVEDDEPDELIVPIGAIRKIALRRAEAERSRLGFALPQAP